MDPLDQCPIKKSVVKAPKRNSTFGKFAILK